MKVSPSSGVGSSGLETTYVVLDSNAIVGNFWLAGSAFRLLREGVRVLPVKVVVPAVVLDEVVNKYREKLTEAVQSHEAARQVISTLVDERFAGESLAQSVDGQVQTYARWLEAELESIGAEVVPYPQISHEDVVRRDLARKKPFKPNGAGYRDLLIWRSVCGVASRQDHSSTVFITSNHKDFGPGGSPHPELIQDLEKPESVRILDSLKAFNTQHVTPILEERDLASQVATGRASTSIRKWLEARLADDLNNEDDEMLLSVMFGVHEGMSVYVTKASDIGDHRVLSAVPLGSGEKQVSVSVSFTCQFNLDYDSEGYWKHEDVRRVVGDVDPNDDFVWASEELEQSLLVKYDFTIDVKDDVVDAELWYISGDAMSVEWSPSPSVPMRTEA